MIRRPPRFKRTDPSFPYTTRFRSRLVTSGCPATGMKREGRCKSGAAPATVTGEADANMPLARLRREGRILQRPGSQETCRSVARSEEHKSEIQSLMRTSYGVFFLEKKKNLYRYDVITPHKIL